MQKDIQAIIFDMDGVLIDSEPYYLEQQYKAMRGRYSQLHQLELTDIYPLVGIGQAGCKKYWAKLCGRVLDDEFSKELDAVFRGYELDYPKIMRKEAPDLLKKLKNEGYKLALASSSSYENINQVLTSCNIKYFFDVIVSGEQFKVSKPNPEIYLFTSSQLHVDLEKCLIVEDSTPGIKAAKSSGANVAALTDTRFNFEQDIADYHLDRLSDLSALLLALRYPIKAAFFDIDGTLVEKRTHYCADSTKRAIKLLSKVGIKTIVCSGRHPLELIEENLLPDLTFDGYIFLNGQMGYFGNEKIIENAIDDSDLADLRDFCQQEQVSCIVLSENSYACNFVDAAMKEAQDYIGAAIPNCISFADLDKRKILQAVLFVTKKEESKLSGLMPNTARLRWHRVGLDLIRKDSGKAKAIEIFSKYLGIGLENCIAFGDGENDIDMLKTVGIGVAMGNADENVKNASDIVTSSTNEGGILKILTNLGIV